MTAAQRLRLVELPLALPVIVAGVRTATVWVVGIATLSTPVGAPSLGNYIFSGLQTRNLAAVLVGCVAAAALALVLDAPGPRARGRGRATPASRSSSRRSCVLAALYAAHGAHLGGAARCGSAPRPIAIGAKTFTEQYILSEILAGQIARTTNLETRAVPSLGSTVAFDALRDGALDCLRRLLGHHLGDDHAAQRRARGPRRRARRGDALSPRDARHHGRRRARLRERLRARDARTHARRARRRDASASSRRDAGSSTIAGDYEFFSRPEWTALRRVYGLALPRPAQHGLVADVRGGRRTAQVDVDQRVLDRRPHRGVRPARAGGRPRARSRRTTRSCCAARGSRATSRRWSRRSRRSPARSTPTPCAA